MKRSVIFTAIALGLAAATFAAAPAQAAGTVHFSRIWYNSPGTDNRSNASLDAEYVTITNGTGAAVQLKGWVLSDASNHRYTFPALDLGKGKSVTVHTGHGTNTSTNLYWGSGNYIWNNDKDKATLKRNNGSTDTTCAYNNSRASYTNC